jgi:hypothetical protein
MCWFLNTDKLWYGLGIIVVNNSVGISLKKGLQEKSTQAHLCDYVLPTVKTATKLEGDILITYKPWLFAIIIKH